MAGIVEKMDPCLQELLNQRQTRPSYNRMLSDKFAETTGSQPSAKQSNEKNQACDQQYDSEEEFWSDSTVDYDDEISSDSSLYYSANEDLVSVHNEDRSVDTSDKVLSPASSERYCAVGMAKGKSKKQKKKRRNKVKEEIMCALPFMNADEIATINCLMPLDKDDIETNAVPTLQALCTEMIARSRAGRLNCIPPGLKTAIDMGKKHYAKKSACLSRLERLASFYEMKVAGLVPSKDKLHIKNNWELLSFDSRAPKKIVHSRSNGSIWYYSGWKGYNYDGPEGIGGMEYKLSLYPNAIIPGAGTVQGEKFSEDSSDIVGNTALAVLSELINIHLPRTLLTTEVGCDEDKLFEKALCRVKERLRKRIPNIVQLMFAEAVPYVWWSRGNLARAEKAFLDIVLDQRNLFLDEQKATYYNELGRLYIQFGKNNQASRSFSAAADLAGTSLHHFEPLYRLQAMILYAAGLDTGVLTGSRTRSSLAAWNMVMQNQAGDAFHLAAQAAIDSVVCHHSGIPLGPQESWLDSTISWLEKYSQEFPMAHLSLSLLNAMLGKELASYQAYRNYMNSFAITHGELFYAHLPGGFWSTSPDNQSSLDRTSNNPWSCLIDEVKCHGPLKAMRVVWRQQFGYFTLEKDRSWRAADGDHKFVCFTRSPDGSIECDIHPVLPVFAPVLLHPLTGSVQYRSEYTHTCRDPHINRELRHYPAIIEIEMYRGSDFTLRYTEGESTQPRMGYMISVRNELKWEGPDGNVSTLNLKEVIKEQVMKLTERAILDIAEQVPVVGRASFIKTRLDILETRAKKGMTVSLDCVNTELETKGIQPKPHKKMSTIHYRKQFTVSLKEFRNLDGAVVLQFSIRNEKRAEPSAFVIVDHTNLQSFMKPFVKVLEQTEFSRLLGGNPWYIVIPESPPSAVLKPVLPSLVCLTSQKKNASPDPRRIGKLETGRVIYDTKGNEVLGDVNGKDNPEILLKDSLIWLEKGSDNITIYHASGKYRLIPNPPDFHAIIPLCGLLLILSEDQLRIYNIQAHNVRWKLYKEGLSLTDDGLGLILNHRTKLSVLQSVKLEQGMSALEGPVHRCLIGYGNHVLVVEIPTDDTNAEEIHCLLDVEVAGTPLEGCFISDKAGFVVTATIHHTKDIQCYSENLYQFSYEGHLISVLPNLGHGPHGFLPVYQGRSSDLQVEFPDMPYGEGAWHLYLRDGHGAVMCARLL